MDIDYAELYPRLFAHHWWWRARETVILAELARLRPDGEWGNILDVGCGDGLFLPTLSKMGHVEGVEPYGAESVSATDTDITIHRVPFDSRFDPGKRFDLILMLDVLEHFDQPAQALQAVERLLEPGGTLFITVPAYKLLWTHHDVLNHHHTRYTRRTLEREIAHTDLQVTHRRYFFHWIFPVRILLRLLEIATGSNTGPPRIPSPWINRTIIGVSRFEYRLLHRLQIPFGSSLLAVTVKPKVG